ncbi:MAG: FAD-binding oxidoreductase [Rhodothermaceae bacterium]|nr:FAD-binding oxidoreductase [Rhodothermaceae bacterium]
MRIYSLLTLDGSPTTLSEPEVAALAGGLGGGVLTPESDTYDETRAIWNGMIDRRPGLIARCTHAADVQHAVRFARKHDLLVAVRGGGHNIAGHAICDDGLLIDLAPMQAVDVDPVARTARVEPGCTLADFDREAQIFGLATPVGINSTTGIAGLTLGGGFGWLSRKYGMTIDNLLAVDIVTPDGQLLRASEHEHPDLFWAIRGGGGNFGIVTAFTFQLHAIGTEVLSGLIVHPAEDADAVLRFYRDFVDSLPDETAVWVVLRKAPPLPFLPEDWHGRDVVVLAAFHVGDMAEGERLLAPLRAFGTPIADVIGPHVYLEWQQAFDPLLTPGARNYWKSHSFMALPDEALDTFAAYARRVPSPHTEIFIGQVGGAMGRVGAEETAYANRDARFIANVHGRWETPEEDAGGIAWSRECFQALTPYATGGVYVNFLTEDEEGRIRAAYGPNYERLAEVKEAYDPENRLRLNQNIRPAVPA